MVNASSCSSLWWRAPVGSVLCLAPLSVAWDRRDGGSNNAFPRCLHSGCWPRAGALLHPPAPVPRMLEECSRSLQSLVPSCSPLPGCREGQAREERHFPAGRAGGPLAGWQPRGRVSPCCRGLCSWVVNSWALHPVGTGTLRRSEPEKADGEPLCEALHCCAP